MKTLIIIPAYNEALNIEKTIKDITEHTDYDYIVINDCSKDNTKEVCEKNGFPMLSLPVNYGLTSGIQLGMKYALQNGYDIAIQFDGDGQHQAKYLKDLEKEIQDGNCDVAIGSRFVTKKKPISIRMLGSNIIELAIKLVTGKKITDPTSGFRAVDKKIIEEFAKEYPTEYPEPESTVCMLCKNYKVTEVPVNMNERQGGTSSIRFWKSADYMLKVCLAIILDSMRKDKKNEK